MDNSKLYCTVYFNYSVEGLPDWTKKHVEKEFMKARDKAVDLLNPHYEEWNEAYTDPVEGEFDEKYNSYISSKQNEILEEFNKTWMSPVELFSDEYADIAGRFKLHSGGEPIEMHMTIKLLNEKEYMEFQRA